MRNYKLSAFALATLVLTLFATPALAQVTVTMQGGQIVINNTGYATQEAFQAASKSGNNAWMVEDNEGNSYEASNGVGISPIIMAEYLDDENPPPPPGGYQDTRDHLITIHGAVITHNATLGVDMVSLPNSSDPVQDFFTIITTDTLSDGTLLIEHLGVAEITNFGSFDEPLYSAPSSTTPYSFPNDPYYDDQWNLETTILSKATWHPNVTAQKAVKVSVIDSGVGTSAQGNDELDGLTVTHKTVASTSGSPVDHGVGIVSLLADKNDDADGIGGLLGSWNSNGCYGRSSMLSNMMPEVYSYNAGDYAPSSIDVALAIKQSIADGVDVINLSLRMAYSPLVEEAITDALDAGITVVAAAGNYAVGAQNKAATFPANLSGVIAVAAGDANLQYISTSADTGADIIAPGDNILVAKSDGTWHEVDGTSFAAPHVTATVAMMIAADPTLTPSQILTALKDGADMSGGTGTVGFLNAGGALNEVTSAANDVTWSSEPFPHTVSCSSKNGGNVATATGTEHALTSTEAASETPSLVNYPNPFNPETTISFSLPSNQKVRLTVYNALGQQVQVLVDGYMNSGTHQARFAAHQLPSGTYFTRLETEAGTFTKSIILMK